MRPVPQDEGAVMMPRRAWRILSILSIVLVVGFALVLTAEAQQVVEDIGQLCLTCHSDFEAKLNAPHVHTPVKGKNCTGCHNPHVSKHKGLLPEKGGKICFQCHEAGKFTKAFQHQPVAKGDCTACHDPHSSAEEYQLRASPPALCQNCHEDKKEALNKATLHPPFKDGSCTICHDVHSSDNPHQLVAPVRDVCQMCHQVDLRFKTVHYKYPVDQADCTQCHDPHASEHEKLFRPKLHPPFAARQCRTCHNPPDGPDPLKTVKPGLELCLSCHPQVRENFKRVNLHLPGGLEACVNCHNPHGASEEKLLKKPMKELCSSCHSDTFGPPRAREPEVVSTHQPVVEGQCVVCHNPHASDQVLFLQKAVIPLCGQCHDQMVHVSHPMETVNDPRIDKPIDCLTCHNPHGTSYQKLLHLKRDRMLCIQCHKKL